MARTPQTGPWPETGEGLMRSLVPVLALVLLGAVGSVLPSAVSETVRQIIAVPADALQVNGRVDEETWRTSERGYPLASD